MEQLLNTKLFIPPTRLEFVSRPRLVERLNKGLHRKLTLISAPAGFGKTTLASAWVEQLRLNAANQTENRIAWLSLDENQKDLSQFLAYLVAALRQAVESGATLGSGTLSMLEFPQLPTSETILTPLINEIAELPHKTILILDDYQTVESAPVDEAITFLVEHIPPMFHLVIITRDDPQLPLARLRARGQLNELRASDLRFTPSEAAEFLNSAMELELSQADIQALETRTEGWIVGLQLLAVSMQDHTPPSDLIQSFSGSHHFVLDYLIEEVLEKQPKHIQEFLLQTSILNRLTGDLCDALTGHDNGQQTLEALEHANLFIVPLDSQRHWYRYHRLFADLLRQRLNQSQFEKTQVLHQRASEWHEKNNFFDTAIEHALAAEDFERAANLIDKFIETIWKTSKYTNLRHWLNELPADLLISKPQLAILFAWNLFTSGQLEKANQYLKIAEQALDAGNQLLSDPVKNKLKGRLFAIRAFMSTYLVDLENIVNSAHKALEYLPPEDLTWRSIAIIALGDAYVFTRDISEVIKVRTEARELSKAAENVYLFVTASLKLASSLRQQGALQQVIEICQQIEQHTKDHGISQTYIAGWLFAIWGEALSEKNQLDEAADKIKNVSSLTEQGGDIGMIAWSHLSVVKVLFSRQELDKAEEILQKIEKIVSENNMLPIVKNQAAYWKVRIWLEKDKLKLASKWMQESGLGADETSPRLQSIEYLAAARILLAQKRLDEVTGMLERMIQIIESRGHSTRLIEVLILKALASHAQGKSSAAIEALERALSLAEPGGFTRIFVDEGQQITPLLYEAMSSGIAPEYTGHLLALLAKSNQKLTRQEENLYFEDELIEPLSEREIEVLQLVAEGFTNKEIAAKLFLSNHTIKVHTRNINRKLGAHNRTESVARARILGFLPDD